MNKVILVIILMVLSAWSADCVKQREEAWKALDREVEQGRVFSKVSWESEDCTWKMISSLPYLLGEFRLKGAEKMDSSALRLMSQVVELPIQVAINQRVQYLYRVGYFDPVESSIRRDSIRNLLYPYLYLKGLPLNQVEFMLQNNEKGYSGLGHVQLRNIQSKALDINFWWISAQTTREIELQVEKKFLFGTHWNLQMSGQQQSLDSIQSFARLGIMGYLSSFDYDGIGFLLNEYFVRLPSYLQVTESGIQYEWLKFSDLRSPIKKQYLAIALFGKDHGSSQEVKYLSQEWKINQPVSLISENLVYKFFGGWQYFFQGDYGSWSLFYPKEIDALRVLPLRGEGVKSYFAHSMEYWWLNRQFQGVSILMEWNEWQRATWNQNFGYGASWSVFQGNNWYFSGSWLFAWKETFENSRIRVRLENRF